MPQYVQEVLGADHLACFFVELARVLDFSPILKSYTNDCGRPAYHPVMMTLLLMYAYAVSVTSSRELERRCETDLAFRYIAGGARPDHDTLCAFRVRHLAAFKALFRETLRVAREMGVLKLGHLSIDGTKMKANASKHKAMSYGRMDEAMKKLDEQVDRLLSEAEAIDAEEERRFGKGRRGDELPKELSDPATRLEKLKAAKQRLEAATKVELAVEKLERHDKIQESKEELERQAREKAQAEGKNPEEAKPDPKAQRNFTDPDSRIMPKGNGFEQAYNAQLAVDAKTQLITAEEVIQTPVDVRQMDPMVAQTIENTGMTPKEVSADAGYFCQADIEAVQARGSECFVPPRRSKHGEQPPPAPRGRLPKGSTFKERMAHKLRTQRGREAYARRKVTVEPVIGQLKRGTLARFSMRGLFKVRSEFSFACAVHNLKKLWRMGLALPVPA